MQLILWLTDNLQLTYSSSKVKLPTVLHKPSGTVEQVATGKATGIQKLISRLIAAQTEQHLCKITNYTNAVTTKHCIPHPDGTDKIKQQLYSTYNVLRYRGALQQTD